MTAAFKALKALRHGGIVVRLSKDAEDLDLTCDDLAEAMLALAKTHKADILRILQAEAFAGRPVIRVEHRGPDRPARFVFEDPEVNLDIFG